jgi:hypothetical protein
MLSLRHCRELVGAESGCLSDEELAVLREQFYSLAALTIDAAMNKGKRTRLRLVDPNPASLPAPPFGDALNLITDDQRATIEERAAILEYDANLTRDEAERAAIVMSNQREED